MVNNNPNTPSNPTFFRPANLEKIYGFDARSLPGQLNLPKVIERHFYFRFPRSNSQIKSPYILLNPYSLNHVFIDNQYPDDFSEYLFWLIQNMYYRTSYIEGPANRYMGRDEGKWELKPENCKGMFVTPDDNKLKNSYFDLTNGGILDDIIESLKLFGAIIYAPQMIASLLNTRFLNAMLMKPGMVRQTAQTGKCESNLQQDPNSPRIMITPALGKRANIDDTPTFNPRVKLQERLLLPPFNVKVWIKVGPCQDCQITLYSVSNPDQQNRITVSEHTYEGNIHDRINYRESKTYKVKY